MICRRGRANKSVAKRRFRRRSVRFVDMAPDPKQTKKTAIERIREEAAKQGVQVEEVRGTPGSGEIFIKGPKPRA